MNVFSNGGVQLIMTWRADKGASCVTFYVPVDFSESDEFSEQIS